MPSIFDKDPCDLYSECYAQFWSTFSTIDKLIDECNPLCPLECEKQTFDHTFSVQTLEETGDVSAVYIFYESLASTM
ncbi:hypothetical protein BpHYR1_020432, partial [Brachionus plicatilis]